VAQSDVPQRSDRAGQYTCPVSHGDTIRIWRLALVARGGTLLSKATKLMDRVLPTAAVAVLTQPFSPFVLNSCPWHPKAMHVCGGHESMLLVRSTSAESLASAPAHQLLLDVPHKCTCCSWYIESFAMHFSNEREHSGSIVDAALMAWRTLTALELLVGHVVVRGSKCFSRKRVFVPSTVHHLRWRTLNTLALTLASWRESARTRLARSC
jgi:hypothetical protein